MKPRTFIEAKRRRRKLIRDLYVRIRFAEEELGHLGVLAALKMWLTKPVRGTFN